MGKILIRDLTLYSYHGCYKEENKIGSQYKLNIWVEGNFSKAEKTDSLADTVDYVKIIEAVNKQMAIRASMIEVPARKIVDSILRMDKVAKVKVEIEKREPPVDAVFDKISFTCQGEN